jgi:hypothetical protein
VLAVRALALLLLLASADTVLAHPDPPECTQNGTAITVTVFRSDGETAVVGGVSECEQLFYVARLQKLSNTDSFCAFSGGAFILTKPDGNEHKISTEVPCIGGEREECGGSPDFLESDPIAYQVRVQDIESGQITASASYEGGVAHTKDGNEPVDGAGVLRKSAVILCTDGQVCTTDTCDPMDAGSAACSNVNSASTTVCRPAAGICDAEERCTGSSGACPADAKKLPTPCRPSAGSCDFEEVCEGDSNVCPADKVATTTVVCRAVAGICDIPESCTGTSGLCPTNAFAEQMSCRAKSGVCDVAEQCTGTSATCPADAVLPTTTVCRSSSAVCDAAERCTGAGKGCPADGFATTTTVCRAAAAVCDAAERCTGTASSCPADGFATTTTVCRAAASVCDAAERCTGAAAGCPADSFEDFGTPCTSDGQPCTDDICSGGSATCTHPPNTIACNDGLFCNGTDTCAGGTCSTHNGNPCPLPDSDGDCMEACNEATDDCTAPDPNDTNCDHPNPCIQGETCQAGECVGTLVPSCGTTTTTEPGPLCGDANQDGDISAPDALLALRTAVGTGDCPAALCDYNGNGQVQSSDALQILRVAVGQDVPGECPPPMLPPASTTSTTTTLL